MLLIYMNQNVANRLAVLCALRRVLHAPTCSSDLISLPWFVRKSYNEILYLYAVTSEACIGHGILGIHIYYTEMGGNLSQSDRILQTSLSCLWEKTSMRYIQREFHVNCNGHGVIWEQEWEVGNDCTGVGGNGNENPFSQTSMSRPLLSQVKKRSAERGTQRIWLLPCSKAQLGGLWAVRRRTTGWLPSVAARCATSLTCKERTHNVRSLGELKCEWSVKDAG